MLLGSSVSMNNIIYEMLHFQMMNGCIINILKKKFKLKAFHLSFKFFQKEDTMSLFKRLYGYTIFMKTI